MPSKLAQRSYFMVSLSHSFFSIVEMDRTRANGEVFFRLARSFGKKSSGIGSDLIST